MRIQVYDELSNVHPDLDGLKLLLSPDLNTWTGEDVWQACQEFDVTICFMESNYNRVLGCYSPEKWRNNNGYVYEVKKGNSFAFYFDQLKMRICNSKK